MAATQTILLVGDGCETCDSLSEWVNSTPYRLEVSRSAQEALDRIDTGGVDVVAVDVRVPRQDGFGLGPWLNAVDGRAPVVAISGESSRKTMERISNRRLYDYVVRPCDVNELGPRLVRALSENRERAAVVAGAADHARSNGAQTPEGGPLKSLRELEREHILTALRRNDWNLGRTSRTLGIHRTSLRSKMKKYGLA